MPIQIVADRLDYVEVKPNGKGQQIVRANAIERNAVYKLMAFADGKDGKTGDSFAQKLLKAQKEGYPVSLDVGLMDGGAFWVREVHALPKG